MRVRWTPAAATDLQNIKEYLQEYHRLSLRAWGWAPRDKIYGTSELQRNQRRLLEGPLSGSRFEICEYGSHPSGCASVELHHFAPFLSHVALRVVMATLA